MAMTKCKECGAEVSTKAEACPKCGAKQAKKTSGCAIIVAGAFAVLIVIPMVIGSVSSRKPLTPEQAAQRQEERLAMAACEAAKDAVRAQLKAPTTAQFPGCVLEANLYRIRADKDRRTYWVESHVDSQNSFGAMIRSTYIVKLERRGDTTDFQVATVAVK